MNKTTKIIVGVVVIIIILLLVLPKSKAGTIVNVGAVLPLTGPGAGVGEILKQGYEFAVSDFNDKGIKVGLYSEDSASDPKQAVSAFNNLVDNKEVKVIFNAISSDGMVLKPIVEQRKDVILWADATHPALTASTSYVLRHSSTAEDGAKVISESILKNKSKKIGIVYQQDDWGVVFNQFLTDILVKNGITVVSEQINNKSTDFRAQLSKIKSQNPDGIVFGVYGSAVGVAIKQTRELGYTGQLYSGVGFGLTPDAQKIAGDYAKGLLYQEYPMNKQFAEDYKKKFGKDGTMLGYVAYTDLEILVYAVQQTKSTDATTLINFIKNLKTFKGKYETVSIQSNGDIVIPTTMKVW